MSRLQFRVWNKDKKEMMYSGFVVRHGNPISEEHWKMLSNGFLGEPYPYSNGDGEGFYQGAEPLEELTIQQQEQIEKIMSDFGGAYYSLIDFSNFYAVENWITMQSTGFHDCTGHIIFEDDILEKDGMAYPIKWYYGCYVWNGCPIMEYDNQFDGERIGANTRDFKIVGNIYENEKDQLKLEMDNV